MANRNWRGKLEDMPPEVEGQIRQVLQVYTDELAPRGEGYYGKVLLCINGMFRFQYRRKSPPMGVPAQGLGEEESYDIDVWLPDWLRISVQRLIKREAAELSERLERYRPRVVTMPGWLQDAVRWVREQEGK